MGTENMNLEIGNRDVGLIQVEVISQVSVEREHGLWVFL